MEAGRNIGKLSLDFDLPIKKAPPPEYLPLSADRLFAA